MTTGKVLGTIFGVLVILNALKLIGVVSVFVVVTFVIAGISIIFNEVFKDV